MGLLKFLFWTFEIDVIVVIGNNGRFMLFVPFLLLELGCFGGLEVNLWRGRLSFL